MKKNNYIIRSIDEADISTIVTDCKAQGLLFLQDTCDVYWFEHREGMRVFLIAHDNNGTCVGYVTLVWRSDYKPFFQKGIPEIKDLAVVPGLRGQGIGSSLLKTAEEKARERSGVVGLGVGVTALYGAAQRLYVKSGYVPDGNGATFYYDSIVQDRCVVIDPVTLWLIKDLK